MKFSKVTALICAAIMAISLLAGCGGSGAKEEENSKEASDEGEESKSDESEESASEDDKESASEDGYDKQALENAGEITITLMVSGVEVENDFVTTVLPKLVKEKWPNVTLEATKLPDDSYYTALRTKLASGECPDIIGVQPMWAGANSCYSLAEAGYLADISDMEYVNIASDLSGMTYEGKVYATSNGISILGTYYNKDMFAEVGITEEPKTWDAFLDACEKLKNAGYQPITMGDKDQYVLQFGLYQLACNQIYSKNPEYDNQLRTGETSFTDEGTWDHVLEMYGELYEKGYIDASQSLGTGASQAIQNFIDGKAAMTFDGSFNAVALMAEGAAGDFERGYFPLPGDQDDGNVYTATCLNAGYGIYSESEYVDECKQLLDWLFDGESEGWDAFVASGSSVVTYGNGIESVPNYDLFKPFIDLMNDGKAFHYCNQAWPAGTEQTMEVLFSEMVGGQGTTIDDITQGMQDKFEDLLEE